MEEVAEMRPTGLEPATSGVTAELEALLLG